MFSQTLNSRHHWNQPVLVPGSHQEDGFAPQFGSAENRWLRTDVHELQKADVGRKYARVDRRPLDPPPVAALHVFECDETSEVYRHPEEIHTLGYICSVDLFPCNNSVTSPQNIRRFSKENAVASSSTTDPLNPSQPIFAIDPPTSFDFTPTSSPASCVSEQCPDEVIHYVDGIPITENSKVTKALVGATFVQPTVIDWQGKKQLMFVFSDLSVKLEGIFLLRYRVFDLFSSSNNGQKRVQCECFGKTFRIYSTKEFPGLQASTELTKHISRYGVRLNTREGERRPRRRKDKDASPHSIRMSSKSSSVKRKRGGNSKN